MAGSHSHPQAQPCFSEVGGFRGHWWGGPARGQPPPLCRGGARAWLGLSYLSLLGFSAPSSYCLSWPHVLSQLLRILVFDEMILPLAYEIGSLTGAAILFGYAVNDEGLMDYYVNKCGFSRLSKELENEINERFRSSFDDDCYFVYLPLFNI